jgi:hypothetical protein
VQKKTPKSLSQSSSRAINHLPSTRQMLMLPRRY